MRDEQAMERYSDEVRCLYQKKVFRPVNPDILMQVPKDRGEFEAEVSKRLQALVKNGKPDPGQCNTRVFKQKLSDYLFHKIEKLGLARERYQTREDSYCYYFHPNAAEIYMALLADYLASADSPLTTPGTDQKVAFDRSFPKSRAAKDTCIAANLFDILPCPSPDTPLRKILRFRTKCRGELLAFRSEMDRMQQELSEATDERHMASIAAKSAEAIEGRCLAIGEALKGDGIIGLLGSLLAFIKTPFPYIAGAGAIAAGYASVVAKVPMSIGIPVVGGVGLLEITSQRLKQRRERHVAAMKDPFAYIFRANKKLG
jgi:Family of unknown function (DUF6236)